MCIGGVSRITEKAHVLGALRCNEKSMSITLGTALNSLDELNVILKIMCNFPQNEGCKNSETQIADHYNKVPYQI